jgi:hypothetical protein
MTRALSGVGYYPSFFFFSASLSAAARFSPETTRSSAFAPEMSVRIVFRQCFKVLNTSKHITLQFFGNKKMRIDDALKIMGI